MAAWITASTYIVAMYMQLIGGEPVKAVGQVDPESPYITSYLLPSGEKCSGHITPSGNVVCTLNNRTIYYFAIKAHAKKNTLSTYSTTENNTDKLQPR